MHINRCVCMNRTFADLRDEAQAAEITDASTLMIETGCGRQCGMCRPYIQAMMRDGRTTFDRILSEDPESGAA